MNRSHFEKKADDLEKVSSVIVGPRTIPDSYRRVATFISDGDAGYITTELSDTRRLKNLSEKLRFVGDMQSLRHGCGMV